MIAYLLLILSILIIYILTNNKRYKNENLFLTLSFIMLFIFAAIRSESTGVDLPTYKIYFISIAPRNLIEQIKIGYFEIGYIVYNFVIYHLTNGNFRILLIITSFLSYYGVFKFIKRYSNNKFLSVILYICIGYYISPFSGLRQCIAISIICISYKYITDRKFMKFLLLIFLAMLFHKSALIFLPAYFLYNYKITGKKSLIFFSIIPLIYIFRYNIVSIIEAFSYSNYDVVSNAGEGYNLLLLYIVIFVLITLYKKKYINNDLNNNMMYNFFYIGILIQILATVEGNAYRAAKYYLISLICILPNMINIVTPASKKYVNIIIFVVSILFFLYTQKNLVYSIFFLTS